MNETKKPEAVLQGPTAEVTDFAMSPDGKTVASVNRAGTAIVWDLTTHRPRRTIQMGGWLSAVAFSPDGKVLAIGAQYGIVKLLDAETGKERALLERFQLAVSFTLSLVFSPDGKMLATSDREGLVRLWDLTTGRLHASLRGHTSAVGALNFSPDGKTLASASGDRTVRLWDVATGQERISLKEHQGEVNSVVFAPDGKTLATGGSDSTVRLWRAATGADAQARQKELDPNAPETPAAHNERGDRLWQSDRIDGAEKAYREALARLEKLSTALPEDPGYSQEMIRSLLSLGLLLAGPETSQEAKRVRQRARKLYLKLSPEQQETLVFRYQERARKLSSSGNIQAIRTLAQAAEILNDAPKNALFPNNLAWLLATCPELKARNPKRAVEFAKKATELASQEGNYWNTLGVAHYRVGDYKAAIAALEKSIELRKGGDSFDSFFLGMARWQLGEKDQARKCYEQAVQWMDKNQPKNEELIRFRAEAEMLIGIK
ncbi:MAG: tetratricopeptide repeat protein [Gemmataceae bacterium]